MPSRRIQIGAGAAGAIAAGLSVLTADVSDRPVSPLEITVARPGVALPVVRATRYRMAGQIRPLLFWIGRDRLGAGHIVWRRGPDGSVAYELLIGTDPEIAPRRLNRWGYLAEEVRESGGRVLGVIVDADADQTLGGVKTRLEGGSSGNAFKAVRATVTPEASRARISTVRGDRELSYRDIESLLLLTHQASDRATPRSIGRPPGARSGFLAALGELIRESVDTRGAPGAERQLKRARPYVYGDKLHDLSLRSHRFHDRREIGDRTYRRVIHAKFQTQSRETGKRFKFEIVYGTEAGLTEVPIWIRYQPRWWLRVQLFLEEEPGELS